MSQFNKLNCAALKLPCVDDTFEARVDAALAERKATAKDLAQAIGITPSAVSQWKKKPPEGIEAGNFLRAAAFLNRDPWYLLTGKGSRTPVKTPDLSVQDQQGVDIAGLQEAVVVAASALILTTPGAGPWLEAQLSRSPLLGRTEVLAQVLAAVQAANGLVPAVKQTLQPEPSAIARSKKPT